MLLRTTPLTLIAAIGMVLVLHTGVSGGDEDNPAAQKDAESASADPFALPDDGSSKELFTFIDKVKRMRPKANTKQALLEHFKPAYGAIIKATGRILKMDELSEDDEVRALTIQIDSLRRLIRYDRTAKQETLDLATKLRADSREALANLGTYHNLALRTDDIPKMTDAERQAFTAEVMAFPKRAGVTSQSFTVAMGLTRSLEFAGKLEEAATASLALSDLVAKSKDERERSFETQPDVRSVREVKLHQRLQQYVPKLKGAAHRLRLTGKVMELSGKTFDGEEFDLASYRGKVVLVDFWATWCRPCLAEIPNHQKMYAAYKDRGFEILAINMDRDKVRMQKYVDDKDLSWLQLVNFDPKTTSWDNPIAVQFGVMSIPATIMIDREGKVVSLRCRGKVLDDMLLKLIGPVETKITTTETATGSGE